MSNFGGDTWKVKGGALYFDLKLDFFGTGNEAGDQGLSIPVQQVGWAAGAEALRRIVGEWYGGLRVWYLRLDSTFDLSGVPPDFPVPLPPSAQLDSEIAGIGVVVQRDSRDNQFNSFAGSLFDLTWSKAGDVIGSDFDFQSMSAAYNIYRKLSQSMVIAGRASACAAPGDTPYYALCKFGQNNDLRGFVGGRYRDETMLAVQAEYRWRFYKRLGMVAFAGVGQVAESFGDYSGDNMLPSGGVGLRFLLSSDNRLNLSVDWAVGKDDDYFYFYVGESF
jgi:outer membrane protein assembly factor BamA